MRTLAAVIVAVGLAVAPAAGVQNNVGTIVGTVFDAVSGVPLSDATVTIFSSTGDSSVQAFLHPALRFSKQSLSAALGQFRIEGVPRGTYFLRADLTGRFGGQYGQSRPSAAGIPYEFDPVTTSPVRLMLWPGGVIEGTVAVDDGSPAVEVRVFAKKLRAINGRRILDPSAAGVSDTTDDRGRYRLANLPPGEYAVVAPAWSTTVSKAAAESLRVARSPAIATATRARSIDVDGYELSLWYRPPSSTFNITGGRMAAFSRVESSSLAVGAPGITVTPGSLHSGIDLQLRRVDTGRIEGMLAGPDGPLRNVSMRLIDNTYRDLIADTDFDVAGAVTDDSGRFAMLGVPAGDYSAIVVRGGVSQLGSALRTVTFEDGANMILSVREERPPLRGLFWLDAPVSVTAGQTTTVSLVAQSGTVVRGRLAFIGTHAAPTAEQLQAMTVKLGELPGTIPRSTGLARITPDGRFETDPAAPGSYFVLVPSPNSDWVLDSVSVAGEALGFRPLELRGDGSIDITVTFIDKRSGITGTVRDADGRPKAAADVVIFPADHAAWIQAGMSPRFIKQTRTGSRGEFAFPTVPPHEYIVFATGEGAPIDTSDPATIVSLGKRATASVIVKPGSQAVVAVRLDR